MNTQAPALPADLPSALYPAGMEPYLQVSATGAQIYACGISKGGGTWIFKAPEAELFDAQNRLVGKHYAGPTWEALAGGKIVGVVKASAPVGTGSIPWLLLDVTSREGAGVFSEARAILRIDTKGGVAPAQGCDEARAGQETRVPYMASYIFLR
ncbi:MAG TPA: DUF3455 domain-containing protein [Xanthobacteraceae bacterium]